MSERSEEEPNNEAGEEEQQAEGSEGQPEGDSEHNEGPEEAEAERGQPEFSTGQFLEVPLRPAGEFADASQAVYQAKKRFIDIMVGQYFLTQGYERTARAFQIELEKTPLPLNRQENQKTKNLIACMEEAFRLGNEKSFFENRAFLHTELNYYQLDFAFEEEIELKARVYFTLYPLIYRQRKNVPGEP